MKPRTLVIVITHPEAEPILRRNWPWILRGEAKIAVVHHENKPISWQPDGANYKFQIGSDPDKMLHRWVGRFVQVCEHVSAVLNFDRYVFIESDVIFRRCIPEDGINTGATLAGGSSDGFLAPHFLHCPWSFSSEVLATFIPRATNMLRTGLNEKGFIDRFLGLYEGIHGPTFIRYPNYSRNTVDMCDVPSIRGTNAWAVHGVKDEAVLKAITEGL